MKEKYMSGLYNALFGVNPIADTLLFTLGYTRADCGRFRDCYIENDKIVHYPVGAVEIRRRFPHTSFPEQIEDADLSAFGVVRVESSPQPSINTREERIEEGTPELNNGIWSQKWNTVALSANEIQQIKDRQASLVRVERNGRLASCDWTQLSDTPLTPEAKSAWSFYRENLRMVPEQQGFPWDVQWPPEPNT